MNENNSNPSDESNQEVPPSTPTIEPHSGDSADTTPPPAHISWLEQFDAFRHEAFTELEKVAAMGLEEVESDLLVALSVKLIHLAHSHDPQALNKFLEQTQDLN